MYFLVKGWLASFACSHEVDRKSQLQVSERANDFAVNRFAATRSFVDQKKEEAGTNGFPPLVRFSLRLRGLLV
jgi:hypothetical protein